jgi:hypothetical protein
MNRRLRAALWLLLAPAVVLGSIAACSNGRSDPGGQACPVVSTDCPSTPPSWTKDVEPIVQSSCLECHSEGGIEWPLWDLSSYASVYRNRAAVLTQVYQCLMPSQDASPHVPPLTSDQRETIVSWIACNAPDN